MKNKRHHIELIMDICLTLSFFVLLLAVGVWEINLPIFCQRILLIFQFTVCSYLTILDIIKMREDNDKK